VGARLLNVVVLTRDYQKMVAWYRRVLQMKLDLVVDEGFDYTELKRPGLLIGFTPARQMKAALPRRRANAVVPQLSVGDVRGFLRRVGREGGKIVFGPSQDEYRKRKYWYGAFADPEGNQIWVVDL
jgi:predicted enzyme related to lactoylglutathione lyase